MPVSILVILRVRPPSPMMQTLRSRPAASHFRVRTTVPFTAPQQAPPPVSWPAYVPVSPPSAVRVIVPLAEPPQGEKPRAKTSVAPLTEPVSVPTPGRSATTWQPVWNSVTSRVFVPHESENVAVY